VDADAERRSLVDLERHLRREDPQLARRLAVLRLTAAGPGPSWPALAGSLVLLLGNAGVFLLAQRWQSRWLLALTVLIFPAVLLPVARSARRRAR